MHTVCGGWVRGCRYHDACTDRSRQKLNSPSKTLASEMSLTAAASTMFRMTNFLMALSLGTHRAQLVQRIGCTWPRPFLARPLFLLFLVCMKTKILLRRMSKSPSLSPLPATFHTGSPPKRASQVSIPSANLSKPRTNVNFVHSSTMVRALRPPATPNLLLPTSTRTPLSPRDRTHHLGSEKPKENPAPCPALLYSARFLRSHQTNP